MRVHTHTSVNHNSLGCEQPPGLDVNQSLIAQDVFLPIPGLISCDGVTGSVGVCAQKCTCARTVTTYHLTCTYMYSVHLYINTFMLTILGVQLFFAQFTQELYYNMIMWNGSMLSSVKFMCKNPHTCSVYMKEKPVLVMI